MMKSEQIRAANTVYANLKKAQEIFRIEAAVISHARCHLLRYDSLEDYHAGGYDVTVYNSSEGYDLYVEGYLIRLIVFDSQIISFTTSRNY